MLIRVDGIQVALKAPHSFPWLGQYGRVFRVFDQQDSGNLAFGVERDGVRRFIKYAGAPTVHFDGSTEDTIARLRHAVTVYQTLDHPLLVRLIDHLEVDAGYAAIFEWCDGENLHPHWEFPPPLKYTHPNSPFRRFRQLPIEDRMSAMTDILTFHVHVEAQDYVAIDFYDGSLLYDFHSSQIRICDIDLYQPKPLHNDMGQMWGSKRFMAPEEFERGAALDARTNVFTMGAMMFALLGGELDRSESLWDANAALHQVAFRAVQLNREHRYASIAELNQAWLSAINAAT